MAKKQSSYSNESISSLKGADRVRKRPAVIFGSDGLEGCAHSIFEILSNSIDEAREGGIPVDYNKNEERYNWELVFCELYAGGKYRNNDGENYEFSLGLNGLGLCATQYASAYMDAEIYHDSYRYTLHFEKGENVGGLHREAASRKQTGSRIRWKPDLSVFTDIDVPVADLQEIVKRQAVVNAGLLFVLREETGDGMQTYEYLYEEGITDYVREIAGEETLTPIVTWQTERRGRDREDKPEYKVKLQVSLCFSNRVKMIEYYHNSSFLEHGGSPERAVKNAFVYQIDAYLKQSGKYLKNESKITYQDIEDCLVLVSISSLPTR